MDITTIRKTSTPTGSASIRLVQRPKAVQPFAVILDMPAHYATFAVFGDLETAVRCFANSEVEILWAELGQTDTIVLGML